jgi:HAD superfamily hydrolase (TIGR01509 family)
MDSMPPPQAVLWDFDGTLVDTASVWFGAERAVVAALGGPAWTPEGSARIHGFSMRDGTAALIEHSGRTGEVDPDWGVGFMEDYVLNVLPETAIEWRPGALDLVAELERRGIPQAVVSMSTEAILRAAMSGLDRIPFAEIVGGDHVERGKPHPEPYLTAAARLGVDPASCVAFEDSLEGRASAEAAGCFVVAIHFHYPHDSAHGRMPVSTLEALPWEGVVGEFERWVASR